MHRDNFCDGSRSRRECSVRFFKCRTEGQVWIHRAQQFIVDYQECIYLLSDSIYSIERLVNLLITFKLEGNSDDTHCENAALFGFVCNHGGCACTSTTAHSCGDEYHLGISIQQSADLVDTFIGSLTSTLGAVASAKTIFSQLHLVRYGRILQRFGVGVANCEVHLFNTRAVHVVYGISTATTHTNHFDDAGSCGRIAHV